jgi:hypothetical protein
MEPSGFFPFHSSMPARVATHYGIGFETKPFPGFYSGYNLSFLVNSGNGAARDHIHPKLQQKFFHSGLNGINVVKACMTMSGKFHVFMKVVGIHNFEHIQSHGRQFLGCRETAVVPENATDKSRPQQHVGPFKQRHLRPGLSSSLRCGTTASASSNNDYLVFSFH